ncbi:anti-sigma factor [Streptomyces sp. NPDC047197]|uniref:anti-sigma factor n=1 Tax=Streptomyces sp. NPDC047197 TaxID=3155477 RepID=UPI0033C02939
MKHLDAADLAELALQDKAPERFSSFTAHLKQCDRCRTELESLRRVVGAARAMSPDDIPSAPPDSVWHVISSELALAPTTGAPEPQSNGDAGHGTSNVPPLMVSTGQVAEESEPRPAGGLRPAVLLAAACLVAGAALGSGATWWQLHDGEGEATRTGTASALAPLAAGDAQGQARLKEAQGPRRQLHIDVSGLPRTDGYFEVWLMDPTHKKLIAVGVLDPNGSATLPLPRGVDLADYPLVDVSDQAYNGSPAHSGKSVVRGSLKN